MFNHCFQLFFAVGYRIAVNFYVATDALAVVSAHHLGGVIREYSEVNGVSKYNLVSRAFW